MSKKVALDWISNNESQIIEVSDKIWEYAELGLMEFKSSALLANTLENHGFDVERGVAGMPTAFVASYGEGGPSVGLMGEYDALPSLSQKRVSHEEPIEEGMPGHGCGHNIHGTTAMAAAIAVREAIEKEGIKGTVRFYGCPAEENYSGKVFMVRDGLFDNLDAVLSHHPGWFNTGGLDSSLAVNSVKFHFHGVATHAAASPDRGKSALDAVELMNIGVNYMREHIVQEARIHYVIEEGGFQPNVVPPYARSWFYVRAPERDQVDAIYEWILKIADGADLMARTTHDVQFLEGIYNVIPNRPLSQLVVENMREIGAPEYNKEEIWFAKKIAGTITREDKVAALRQSKRPNWEEFMDVLMDRTIPDAWNEGEVMPGSTDVADVSWVAPTMEFTTATTVVGIPYHSWQNVALCGMSIGHKSLIFAAKAMAVSALDFLTKSELREKVQEDFESRKAGREYKCPVPPDVTPPLEVAREAAKAAGQKIE
ncbi:amidohydrolase [Candidatus Thorarchaeota archaeon]|nr:MAG: amidohydrolase [Candidatus Thorarchaeota archaeon]